MRRMAILMASWMVLSVPAPAAAADKGHGSMPGMTGEKTVEGHGMMSMGDLVFEGKIGPWEAKARLIDMKAEMEKAKVSGKMKAMMKNTHHLLISLEDPATKTPVTKGKGSVTVGGADKTPASYTLTGMQGHFGSDVTLDKPGRYTFDVRIESDGKSGTATFGCEIK